MMKKNYTNSFILSIFSLNVLFLVFSSGTNEFLKLFSSLLTIIGLVWLIYFYLQLLDSESATISLDNNLKTNDFNLELSPDSQFLNLLDSSFALIKDLNSGFESAVYFLQPESDKYEVINSSSDIFTKSFSSFSSFVEHFTKENKAIILYQKDEKESWTDIFKDHSPRGSECAIIEPIFLKEMIVGVLIIRSEHFSNLNEQAQLLVKNLVDIISIAILDLELLEETISRKNDQAQIFDLLTQINLSQSESEILNKFRNIIHYYFKYDCLTISAIKSDGKNAKIKLIDGIKKYIPSENNFNINGTINGLPYIKDEIINGSNKKYNLFRFSSKDDKRELQNNFLGIPIYLNETLWGAVLIESFGNQSFNSREQQLLGLIAKAMQTSMSWFVEYQNVYEDAIKDGLTGLLNHKTYIDRAGEEIERARRFQHQLVFLIYDLDKFKRINDTLGHPYGDYVIKTTAKIIKDNVRSIDLVARYGGEEFSVVLVNTNKEAATTVAKRIVSNIAEHNFSMNNKEVDMTISCGLSEYPKDSDKLKDLIQYADEGLYKTKDNGGNDVTIYSSMSS